MPLTLKRSRARSEYLFWRRSSSRPCQPRPNTAPSTRLTPKPPTWTTALLPACPSTRWRSTSFTSIQRRGCRCFTLRGSTFPLRRSQKQSTCKTRRRPTPPSSKPTWKWWSREPPRFFSQALFRLGEIRRPRDCRWAKATWKINGRTPATGPTP